MQAQHFDCAIIGGGVAGLSLAIQMARVKRSVVLFEKEVYPFHKVCGEYISSESIPFLESLGLPLRKMQLPVISQLLLSSPSGISIRRPLDIGGTGLSRYELDNRLYELALSEGVTVLTGTKVNSVAFENDAFIIRAGNREISARSAAGAYGKNSNIDVQLGRSYKAPDDKAFYIAVKHHIKADFDPAFVEMHNFPGGYCGLSAIEDGKVNLSYISKVSNLKTWGSIPEMEKNILSKNPFLKNYFSKAHFIFDKPLTISHLYFEIKQPVSGHLLMLGDAAGNIAPLSGNGMSMALKSSKIASGVLLEFLTGKTTRNEMEQQYARLYSSAFAGRIRAARYINKFFGNPALTNGGFRFLRTFPVFVDLAGKMIHGQVF